MATKPPSELSHPLKAPIIIALTSSAFEQEQQVALEAGCDDFVRKPYRGEVIFEKMTQS